MAAIETLREQFESGILQYKKLNEICRLLGVTERSGRDSIEKLLKNLEESGEIVRDEKNRYVTPEKLGLIRGILQGNERGFAFLVREDGPDLFLPARSLRGALHKDEVFARLVGGERGDEGEVYSIIRRGMPVLTGVYYRDKKGGMVEADERRFSEPVHIVGGKERAVTGEKVLVKIVAYPEGKFPDGEIEEILGRGGDLETEEEAIIRMQGLAQEFPQKVSAEAARVSQRPVSAAGRRDFRMDTIITIDGEDSRDFDDAVSVRKDGDFYMLGVHIADVTEYVLRGGAMDKEAFSRGTSVYFPDRVLPMLPKELSNGICSLNEGEDRLTLSCILRLDANGNVVDSEIVKGIIRSCARMTYTKVAAMLEGDAALQKQYAHILPMCEQMWELAKLLIEKRDKRGSIDLDVRETKIVYENGEIEISEYERTNAHRLIEEFMILANETVAEFMAGYEMPFVYRVHEKPSEEKAAALKGYLQQLGIPANFHPENVRPGEYGKILKELEGSELFRIVNGVMLRSMSKAKYSAENEGHFGLASACYCHFTSPIRRYPDLLIHRIVKLVIDGQAGEAEEQYSSFVSRAAESCSVTERRADEAERDVDELYKTWYMRGHIGEEYEGVISGVTAFGVFVELENTVEGLVRVENLPADEYIFIEQRYLLQGARRSYKIGDPLRIRVAGCDIGTRRCEFLLAQEEEDKAAEPHGEDGAFKAEEESAEPSFQQGVRGKGSARGREKGIRGKGSARGRKKGGRDKNFGHVSEKRDRK